MNYITKNDGIRIINKMLNGKIRDFYSYNKLVKKILDIKTNIPIYIDKNTLLLPIKTYKAYDCIWINYFNVLEVVDLPNKTLIKFKNEEIKAFEIDMKKYNRIVNNAIKVLNYFSNLINWKRKQLKIYNFYIEKLLYKCYNHYGIKKKLEEFIHEKNCFRFKC